MLSARFVVSGLIVATIAVTLPGCGGGDAPVDDSDGPSNSSLASGGGDASSASSGGRTGSSSAAAGGHGASSSAAGAGGGGGGGGPPTSSCPADRLCFSSPVYTSKVGTWFTNIYRNANSPTLHPGEAFMWSTSRYQPAAGFYNSDDPAALAHHLDEMRSAEIDFLVLDGTNGWTTTVASDTDQLVAVELGRPVADRVPISMALGAQLWAVPPGTANAVANHMAEVNAVYENLAANATGQLRTLTSIPPFAEPIAGAWYQLDGKPLLLSYNNYPGPTNGLGWNDARFSVRLSTGIVDPTASWVSWGDSSGWWGWVTEYPQVLNADGMAVTPGADNAHRGCSGCTFTIDRQGGTYYELEWLRAIEQNPRSIIVAGWNDYIDETFIEPSSPIPGSGAPAFVDAYGNETPDWYLQITRAYSALRTGLLIGSVYVEENTTAMFQATATGLVPQAAYPVHQPLIVVPQGTFVRVVVP